MSWPSDDTRPAWAQRMALPDADTLHYVQLLATATLVGILALYVVCRGLHNPRFLGRALRSKVGA